MRRLVVILVLFGLACVALAQKKGIKFPKEKQSSTVKVTADSKLEAAKGEVRIGPDGRPLLFGPNIELCKNRKYILICFECVNGYFKHISTIFFNHLSRHD